MDIAVSTNIKPKSSSLTVAIVVVVSLVGAVLLMVPAIWMEYSISHMSGSGRGYSELDNAIRGEENFKVGFSVAIFVVVGLVFLGIDATVLAVRRHLRHVLAWTAGIATLLLPPALVFGYFAVVGT